MKSFADNIEKLTKDNQYYRKVLYTVPNSGSFQLVLMRLEPGEEIGSETHPDTTQFIRVEKGRGSAQLGRRKVPIRDGSAIVIPPGMRHNVTNTSRRSPLLLYTIYTPSEHPPHQRQRYKK